MSAASDLFPEATTKYDYIRFSWADLHGISRSRTVPSRNLARFWKKGIHAYAGLQANGPGDELVFMEKVVKRGYPNCKVVPDGDTFHNLAWSGGEKYRVGEVLCETYWLHDGTVQGACTRHVAKKQLDRLKNLGYSLLSSSEVEFSILDAKTKKPVFGGVESCISAVLAQQESIIFDIDDLLFKSGVNIETIQTEHGPGQFEFALIPTTGIKAADNMFIFKSGVREICHQRGLQANFMAKPSIASSPNGCHFNHSLWDASNKSVFYEHESADGFSDIAKHWFAGLIKHAPALTALCCPTINCYRRLYTEFSPTYADWGTEDRTTAFRCKNEGADATYVENRLPSAASNPYLVVAGTIAAGLDGIEKRLECPPPKDPSAQKLPMSLRESIVALKADTDMVDALGTEFVEWFVAEKEEVEISNLADCDITKEWTKDYIKEQEIYSKYI